MCRLCIIVATSAVLAACGARTDTIDPWRDAGGDAEADTPLDPPTVTCSPLESWTTIDRRAVVASEAGDTDGWIAEWEWTVAERPAGSVVVLVPEHAPTTSLTPDAAGDYTLQVEVTDNDGLTASCTAEVHSIVGPPVAFCPDDVIGAVVGRPYTLEGDGFDDEALVSFSWEVTARPAESRAQPEPTDQPVTMFTPDAAGTFELTFTVTDNDGQSARCTVSVSSSGPPTAICPEDSTAPTRQRHLLHGAAEDDGAIAVWSWDVVESPPGSSARPEPATAQDSWLTPDRVGRYVLRLTVTDDTGLSDSCETTVEATPTPPTAVCPDGISTSPLTEVTLRGEAVDDGVVVGWEWELVATPPGSSSPPPSPPDAQVTMFMPDVAGEYTIRLTVVDDDGMEGSCETTVAAIPGEGLRVELYWNPPDRSCDTYPGSDCDPTDVDLHLLHPEAPSWFHSGAPSLDCYFATCVGGTEWDEGRPEDNPRLDLDDTEGFGPENINIDEPIPGHEYFVGVHYYFDDGRDTLAQTYIRIYCGMIDVDPVYEIGPIALAPRGDDPMGNDFWRVATVTWDGFTCHVSPSVGPDGGADIIIASEAAADR